MKEVPTKVNIDFICQYLHGDLQTSEESLEVGWFTRQEALELVKYPPYVKRFYNMVRFDGIVQCCAFKVPFEFTEEYTV